MKNKDNEDPDTLFENSHYWQNIYTLIEPTTGQFIRTVSPAPLMMSPTDDDHLRLKLLPLLLK